MKKLNTTKKLLMAVAVAAGLFFTVSSCKKSSSDSSSVTLTETQAAEITTDAITPSTGGMVSQVSSSAVFYTATESTNSIANHLRTYSNVSCGVVKDTTISYISTSGTVPSFSYSLSWENNLACTVPSTFICAFEGQGNYTGPFLISAFSSAGTFTLSGLTTADTAYTFNSNFQRQGTTSTRQGTVITFNHSLRISSSNIVYGKTSKEIISGTATVAVIVTNSSGKSWNYNGTLTFLGHKTAKLVLNSGTVYTIQWS